MKVGDTFKIACRSYKRASVFRVEKVDERGVHCIDQSETSSVECIPITFKAWQIDWMRERGQIKEVKNERTQINSRTKTASSSSMANDDHRATSQGSGGGKRTG